MKKRKLIDTERTLYLPSVGFCLLVAIFCEKIAKKYEMCAAHTYRNQASSHRSSTTWLLVGSAIISLAAARTVSRNADWRDELSLFSSAVDVSPAKGGSRHENLPAVKRRTSLWVSQRILDYCERTIQEEECVGPTTKT